ncbi:MAG TPA: hypothetical protein VNB24_10165 [Acidimicrobiales bacterium]|nr:hypothetical protein [Acidimicrobiales bacterium]
MRKHLSGWAASALVVATLGYMIGVAVSGYSAVTPAPGFKGFATATPIHVDALQASATSRLADVEVAFSGAAADSAGFGTTSLQNEMQINIQPNNTTATPPAAFPGKNASGRGSGIEVGANTPLPSQTRQIVQAGEAQAVAPPNTDLVTRQVLGPTIPTNPVLYASLLRGQAQAVFDPNPCLANPIALGLGYIADAQLLNAGTAGPDGRMSAPVLATDDPNPERAVTQSRSVVYPIANGDGTFGLVSETRSTFAPINIARNGPTPAPDVIIEVLGEWIFRATATGKTAGAKIEQTVRTPTGEAATPTTTVIRISTNGGTSFTDITFQQLPAFGASGFVIPAPLAPIIQGAIGEDARAIAAPGTPPNPTSTPTVEADGTEATGAADVLRIQILEGNAAPAPAGAHAADLRIGHQEASVEVPAGGFRCTVADTTTTTADASTTTSSTSSTTAPTTTSAPATSSTTRPAVSPTTTQRPANPPPPAPPARPVVVSPNFVG